jgi:hypothetical protein
MMRKSAEEVDSPAGNEETVNPNVLARADASAACVPVISTRSDVG